ncbi:hypothetical protein AB4Y32_21845 [Paraburkholderia phymatum]|uniref:Uncharacterized protein n=1 Tax=Paraburkholderia phymatum TaxID=148447 RepID=A0ACC6U495_9BURK
MHFGFEPQKAGTRHCQHGSARHQQPDKPVRRKKALQGQHDPHGDEAHEQQPEYPFGRLPWRRAPSRTECGTHRDQNVEAIMRKQRLRLLAEVQHPEDRNSETCEHAQIQHPRDGQRNMGGRGEFAVKGRNGQQAPCTQEPADMAPCANRSRTIVRIHATDSEYAEAVIHRAMRDRSSHVPMLHTALKPERFGKGLVQEYPLVRLELPLISCSSICL